jgi:hypothetical protein
MRLFHCQGFIRSSNGQYNRHSRISEVVARSWPSSRLRGNKVARERLPWQESQWLRSLAALGTRASRPDESGMTVSPNSVCWWRSLEGRLWGNCRRSGRDPTSAAWRRFQTFRAAKRNRIGEWLTLLIVERCRREMPFKRIRRSTALKKSVLRRAARPVITRQAYRRGVGRQSSSARVAPNILDCPRSYRRAIAPVS